MNESSNNFEGEEDYKPYKIKTYPKDEKDPTGVTINCNTHEYLRAHEQIRKLIKKAKQYSVGKVNLRILDVTEHKGGVNAKIEVSENSEKGQVDLKIYNPSVKKRKEPQLR